MVHRYIILFAYMCTHTLSPHPCTCAVLQLVWWSPMVPLVVLPLPQSWPAIHINQWLPVTRNIQCQHTRWEIMFLSIWMPTYQLLSKYESFTVSSPRVLSHRIHTGIMEPISPITPSPQRHCRLAAAVLRPPMARPPTMLIRSYAPLRITTPLGPTCYLGFATKVLFLPQPTTRKERIYPHTLPLAFYHHLNSTIELCIGEIQQHAALYSRHQTLEMGC